MVLATLGCGVGGKAGAWKGNGRARGGESKRTAGFVSGGAPRNSRRGREVTDQYCAGGGRGGGNRVAKFSSNCAAAGNAGSAVAMHGNFCSGSGAGIGWRCHD